MNLLQVNAADLFSLLEKMKCEVTDKTSLRYLNKFGDLLRKINSNVTGTCLEGVCSMCMCACGGCVIGTCWRRGTYGGGGRGVL